MRSVDGRASLPHENVPCNASVSPKRTPRPGSPTGCHTYIPLDMVMRKRGTNVAFGSVTNMSSDPSMEWVRRAGDFRVLIGKRDGLGQALGADDEARLAELSRHFLAEDENRGRLPWAHRDKVRAD